MELYDYWGIWMSCYNDQSTAISRKSHICPWLIKNKLKSLYVEARVSLNCLKCKEFHKINIEIGLRGSSTLKLLLITRKLEEGNEGREKEERKEGRRERADKIQITISCCAALYTGHEKQKVTAGRGLRLFLVM